MNALNCLLYATYLGAFWLLKLSIVLCWFFLIIRMFDAV